MADTSYYLSSGPLGLGPPPVRRPLSPPFVPSPALVPSVPSVAPTDSGPALLEKFDPMTAGFHGPAERCANCVYFDSAAIECRIVDVIYDDPERSYCRLWTELQAAGL